MNKMTILTMSYSEIMWSVFFLAMGMSFITIILVYTSIEHYMSTLTLRKVRDDFTITFIVYFVLLLVSGILE